ncbi:MAG: hypothetical protein PHP06_09240 [Clostridia bacterium]|nr:hypothetical protein [Clostridia bacterium]
MYSSNDLEQAKRHKNIFFITSFVLIAIFLVISVYCIVDRNITFGRNFTLIFVVLSIFLWGMVGEPLYRYFLFLNDMFKGKSHKVRGKLKIGDQKRVFRNRLFFWKVFITEGDVEKIFYIDSNKELPAENGREVEVEIFESYIKNIQITER